MTRQTLKDNIYINSNIKYTQRGSNMNFNLRAKLLSIVYKETIYDTSAESSGAPDLSRVTHASCIDDEMFLYRLGDFYYHIIQNNKRSELSWMIDAFPETIISSFVLSIDESDDTKSKERKFLNIISEEIKDTPTGSTARMHLRTGDILSISRHIGTDWRMYTSTDMIARVVPVLNNLKCTDITIYSGTHERLGSRTSEVEEHLDEMVDQMYKAGDVLASAGISVQYHSGSADDDFIGLLAGEIFIPTKGEYSGLIANYAKKLNKTVIMNARE